MSSEHPCDAELRAAGEGSCQFPSWVWVTGWEASDACRLWGENLLSKTLLRFSPRETLNDSPRKG